MDTKEGMLNSVQVGQRRFDQDTVSGFLQNENPLSREMSRNVFFLFLVLLSLFYKINREATTPNGNSVHQQKTLFSPGRQHYHFIISQRYFINQRLGNG